MAQSRTFLTTGVALVSAVAIAAGPGLVASGSPTSVAAPSLAEYQLTALSDITAEGAIGALASGWGGYIGPDDVFYPNTFNNDVKLTGFNGLAYYLADQALDGIAPYHLPNYFFEVGSRSATNQPIAGLGAMAYVAVGSTFGVDSIPAQLVKSIVAGSLDFGSIGGAIVAFTASVPVVGALASVYFTGQAPGDETVYGTGVAGVVAYAETALPGISGILNQIGDGFSFEGWHDEDDDEDGEDHDGEDHDGEHHDGADEDGADEDDDEHDGDHTHRHRSTPESAAAVTAVSVTSTGIPVKVVPADASADASDDVRTVKAAIDEPGAEADAPAQPVAPRRGSHRAHAADTAGLPAHIGKRIGRPARNS